MENYITISDARKRNLLIIILKEYVKDKISLEDAFSFDEIHDKFYFRRSDLNNYLEDFFVEHDCGEDRYQFTDKIKKKLNYYKQKYLDARERYASAEKVFVQKFNHFRKKVQSQGWHCVGEDYELMFEEIKEEVVDLHWSLLPLYKEQMIFNRGVLPDDDIMKYYNHYHALEDLFYVVNGTYDFNLSYRGDVNLDYKMSFRVYSRRWEHDDVYSVTRTVDGWKVSHLSFNGIDDKDGSKVLIESLKHDSIQFPEEGIKYAFESLWHMADEKEMSTHELEVKLQEIADWISSIEKVVGSTQPNWCEYY